MKKIISMVLAALTFTSAQSQKLPNKQEAGFKAPSNIKIDGKPTEWGDFKAYNSATSLYYTLANDEQNLYLVLKAGDRRIMDKIFGGGVSLFFINPNTVDKDARAAITYLAFPKTNRYAIGEMMKDTVVNDLKAINNAMAAALKTISVKKLDGINEETIAVYNEYGIMAASYLTNLNTYTCEIAIPLKHIKSFISSKRVINYTLQANAVSLNSMKVVINGKETENVSASPQLMEMINSLSQSDPGGSLRETLNDTNVSGEYDLAK